MLMEAVTVYLSRKGVFGKRHKSQYESIVFCEFVIVNINNGIIKQNKKNFKKICVIDIINTRLLDCRKVKDLLLIYSTFPADILK